MTTTTALSISVSGDQANDLLEYQIPYRNFKILNLSIISDVAISNVDHYCSVHSIPIEIKYSRDIRRLYYSEVIKLLTQHILADKSTCRFILFIDTRSVPAEYQDILKTAIHYLVAKIKAMFQFPIIHSPYYTKPNRLQILAKHYEQSIVYAVCAIDQAIGIAEKFDTTKFSTKKLRKFLADNELNYLKDTFFMQLSAKLISTK